jgi:serine/threonine-protein kinase
VSPLTLERFRREARLGAQLTNDNIVRVYDFGTTTDGKVFLAMERLEGQSIEQHLVANGALEYRSALLLGAQICRALEAAHEQGVVHGDLKPQNLFLTRQGTVKLLDFGVSALYRDSVTKDADAPKLDPVDGAVTKERDPGEAFALTGTPEYLAPEQLRGQMATPQTDQYALGVVLYELLTGVRPHDAESIGELLGVKLAGTVKAPSVRAPMSRLPKSVDRLCLRLLANDSAERFESMAAVRVAIESILDAAALGRKKPGRAMQYAVASTLLVLGAIGGVASSAPLRQELTAFGEKAEHYVRTTVPRRHEIPALKRATVTVEQSMGQALAVLERTSTEPRANAGTVADSDGVLPEASVVTPRASDAPQLATIERSLANDKPVKALDIARKLGASGVREPKLYRLWIEAATKNRAFGEACRIAKQLATVEPSVENQMQLAQLERRLGRNEAARRTLAQLLEKSPNYRPARALLERLEGRQAVAAR